MISKAAQDHLRNEMRKQMNELADTMATGGCRSFDEYKHLAGQIAGLAFAERMLLDMVEDFEKKGEADEQ